MRHIVFVFIFLCACSSESPSPSSPLPTPEKYVYWIAECHGWPYGNTDDASGLVQVGFSYGKTVKALFSKSGAMHSLFGVSIGSIHEGNDFFVFKGPETIMNNMKLSSTCTSVGIYNDVYLSMGETEKNWLKAKSVCHGLASINDNVIDEWPCWWEGTRNGFVVNSIDSVSPGITMGGTINVSGF